MKYFSSSMSSTTDEQLTKTIQIIQRHRKQRHTRFKEMAREEEEGYSERSRWARRTDATTNEVICPVCSQGIRGDQEVIDAHVDTCLAEESRRLEEVSVRRTAQDSVVVDVDDWSDMLDSVPPDGAVGHVGNVRGIFLTIFLSRKTDHNPGTGFHTRDPTSRDVDDEIDIDGDDQGTYGEAQFTEGDILPVDEGNQHTSETEDVDIDIDGDQPMVCSARNSLRDLIAEGRVIQPQRVHGEMPDGTSVEVEVDEVLKVSDVEKLDSSILQAKQKGDKRALVAPLEDKIKQLVHSSLSFVRSTKAE
jgi:hypothetical protein